MLEIKRTEEKEEQIKTGEKSGKQEEKLRTKKTN